MPLRSLKGKKEYEMIFIHPNKVELFFPYAYLISV